MSTLAYWRLALGAMVVALLVAACGGVTAPVAKSASGGKTVTFAEQPGSEPNYIFPLLSSQYFDSTNQEQFQFLMYRPLYWFGDDGHPVFNSSFSLAAAPVYSDHDKVVTVTMKNYKWSNGTAVDARDVIFWMNLIKVEKAKFGPYVPGTFPDNVASYQMTSARTVKFTLTHAVSTYWFTYNELSQVTPLPLDWDRISATSGEGHYDQTPAGATKVYDYLAGLASQPGQDATNPVWQVVDGPWRLSKFIASTGYAAFVPNPHYSGADKPKIARFVELPFTSDQAEFDSLRSGQVDYGYIPTQDVSQIAAIKRLGYRVNEWNAWAFTYIDLDYLNPAAGPIFDQPYVRQTMQSLIDQPQFIRTIYNGDAVATNGPVPLKPSNPFVSTLEKKGVYSYSPSRAVSLLRSHGWHVVPGGVTTCTDPGTGSGQCGSGIAAGARLSFGFEYSSGTLALQLEVAELQSTFAKQVGITLSVKSQPPNQLLASTEVCAGTSSVSSKCDWQISFFGAPRFLYEPDFYPTGEDIYATDAADSGDGYSNAQVDSVITASYAAGAGVSQLKAYENLIVNLVPTLFMPTPPVQISAIRSSLHGAIPQDPMLNLNPEKWSWSS
jgi:peptide/nickel transport system substrate-binding protein